MFKNQTYFLSVLLMFYMQDSEKLIQQAEAEELAVFLSCVKQSGSKGGKITIPPPPILIRRTENSMVFKPAPFKSGIKVINTINNTRCF